MSPQSVALKELKLVCLNAVRYVGMANYDSREMYARQEIRRAFDEYEAGECPKPFGSTPNENLV